MAIWEVCGIAAIAGFDFEANLKSTWILATPWDA